MALTEQFGWLKTSLTNLRTGFNGYFVGKDPFQIFVISAGTTVAGLWVYRNVKDPELLQQRVKEFVFRLVRRIPAISREINDELTKMKGDFAVEAAKRCQGLGYLTRLPDRALTNDEIMAQVVQHLKLGDYDWREGFVSGTVYHQDSALCELVAKVYGMTSYTNPLHPDIFPGIVKMEAEVVRMSLNLFNGGEDSCGAMTTGGTESILMAMKACRDYGKETRGVSEPEVVLPRTAHPAFEKAAKYFGLRLKYVPVDPDTLIVRPRDMARKITRNTVALVVSAVNFPYGTLDPVPEVAALGLRHNIPVHVDMCLGGFVAAFMERAGCPLPHRCDFTVPGVTSISADMHKYGYTPKGASVVLYSKSELLHAQYCVSTDWPGGVYGSPTVNGSRAGGVIASCWAAMLSFGMEGYINATRDIIAVARYIERELRNMKGIFVYGTPATTVIAVGSKNFHPYTLLQRMNSRGWTLNALQYPSGMHITVTLIHTRDGVKERFVADMRKEIADLLASPPDNLEGRMAVYGKAQGIPDRSVVGEFTKLYLDGLYFTDSNNLHPLLKK